MTTVANMVNTTQVVGPLRVIVSTAHGVILQGIMLSVWTMLNQETFEYHTCRFHLV